MYVFIITVLVNGCLRCSPRCSGGPPCLGGTSAAPHSHTMWSLVEEGPKGERKVWSHRLPHLPAEKLHFEEAGQYLSSMANQSIFGPAALRFCFPYLPLLSGYWDPKSVESSQRAFESGLHSRGQQTDYRLVASVLPPSRFHPEWRCESSVTYSQGVIQCLSLFCL